MQNRVVEIKVTSEITNTTKLKYELESVAWICTKILLLPPKTTELVEGIKVNFVLSPLIFSDENEQTILFLRKT